MPLPEDLGKLYARYFTHAAREGAGGDGPGSDLKRRERASLAGALGYAELRQGAGSLLDRLHGSSPFVRERAARSVFWLPAAARGRLLDIGCGNGRFLNRMRSLGWQVAGVDFDADAVRVARNHYGLDARCGSADAVGFEPASFDVVTLDHVIEHLPDPRASLAAAASLLRPGGTLALATPNFASLDSRIHREDWHALDPPRHLYLFSPASIRRCVEGRDGAFTQVAVRSCAASARSTWGRSRLLARERRRRGMQTGPPSERGYSWYKLVEGRLFNAVEHALNFAAPVGEELVLFARRA